VKTENNESYPFEILNKTKSRKKINRFPNSVFSSPPNKREVLLSDRFSLKLKSSSLNPKAGIAEFQRDPKTNEYTGSILTQTGDYRYLAGNRMGNQLYISTFDGVHAYSFLINIKENGHIEGIHFSGESYSEPFTGVPDSSSILDDPYKITKIINDKSKLDIILPEYKSGELVRVTIGEGKVTLIQVMGSWCPNCLDESSFFNELSGFDNLNIYALAFEKNKDRLRSLNSIKRIESYLDLKYPILFAGKAQKSEVERLLPISNFISYPTYLLFDKKGDLVEIHAGFSGPATKGYSKFTSEFRSKIQSLISHSHGQ
jgi:thiol-disulfide isomerase/thioredoxin